MLAVPVATVTWVRIGATPAHVRANWTGVRCPVESFGLLPPRNGRGDYEANQRDGWGEQADIDQHRETWSKRGLRGVIRPVRQSLGREHRSVDAYQKRQRYEKHPPKKRAIPLESGWRRQRHNPEHSRPDASFGRCWRYSLAYWLPVSAALGTAYDEARVVA